MKIWKFIKNKDEEKEISQEQQEEESLKQKQEQQSSDTTNQTQPEQITSTESGEDESLDKETKDNNEEQPKGSTSLTKDQSPSKQENDKPKEDSPQSQSSLEQEESSKQTEQEIQEQSEPINDFNNQTQIEQITSTESGEDESLDKETKDNNEEQPKGSTSLTKDQSPSKQEKDKPKETSKQIESTLDQKKNVENQTTEQNLENQTKEKPQNKDSEEELQEQEDLTNDTINQNEIEKTENQNTKEENNQKEQTKKSKEETNTKEKLQNYRDILSKIQKGQEKEQKQEEEDDEEINETNEFLESLKDLPLFKDRDRGDGYSIDTHYSGSVPDSVIRMIINKFLNQRFLKKDSTLNSRTKSLEKTYGFYKLNSESFIKHLETGQLTKIQFDKYDYKEESGRSESVPFSFYFDLSGSMSKYTGLLSVLAIELLKKDVKVLIGFNEKVNVQIDKIKGIDNIEDLKKLLTKFGDYYYGYNMTKDKLIKESGVYYRIIRENIDNYLIRKRAEKCVIYSDFDPTNEICNLSIYSQVYWFCFEEEFTREDLEEKYNGFLYKVQNLNDIVNGILVINERKFKNLCYIDDPNILKKKIK